MPAPQATRWCGTAWTEDPPTPQDASKVRYHCGALENCPTTGKEHYQIYFELFKKTTLTGALALFGLTGSELHLDICRGSGFDNRQYIKGPYDKDGKQKPANDTFYEHGTMSKGAGHRTDLDEVQKALDDGATFEEVSTSHFSVVARCSHFVQAYARGVSRKRAREEGEAIFADAVLRPWQSKYEDILVGEVDHRAVYWVYDYIGNTGKSFFISYMCAKHGAISLAPARVVDLAFAYDMQKIVLFDLARTTAPSEDKAHTLDSLYSFIEMLKNGRIFSSKYESVTKTFACPHVMVVANFPPDQTKLSADRWQIEEI